MERKQYGYVGGEKMHYHYFKWENKSGTTSERVAYASGENLYFDSPELKNALESVQKEPTFKKINGVYLDRDICNNFDIECNRDLVREKEYNKITFKKDGLYAVTAWYGLSKWNDEVGHWYAYLWLRDCPKINTDGYICHPRNYNEPIKGDMSSGFYPYVAMQIIFIEVKGGNARRVDISGERDYCHYKIPIRTESDALGVRYTTGTAKIWYTLADTLYFGDIDSNFNEYRSLVKNHVVNQNVTSNTLTLEVMREVDYYDGWGTYNDRLYIALIKTQVIKFKGE